MKITPLTANQFLTDGGAMFGLVPKTLWSRHCAADAENRILQRAIALLIETDDGKRGLAETGCGDPAWFSERERELHGLETEWLLPQALKANGIGFDDIDFILLSHAHWDHAGGLTYPDGSPVFPNAEIFLRSAEVDCATGGDPLLYKSYPAKIQQVFSDLADRIFPVPDADPEVLPGIYLLPAAGHTEGQACISFTRPTLVGCDREVTAALFAADNCPTQHHLRMVFQSAYDTYPLKTRDWKRTWLPRCAGEQLLLLFSHDADAYGAWIAEDTRKEFIVTETYVGRT
jgi:glyoxylase-like metal-dependent hydrolase (beta-lactamase superfamily II)